jgi:hypothetical protein
MPNNDSKKLPVFTGKDSGIKRDGVQLKGVSYSDWRFKLRAKAVAAGQGIWEYMARTTDNRPAGANDEKYYGFYATIVDSLQDDALTAAKNLGDDSQSPRAVLRELDRKYMAQTMSARMTAITELCGRAQGFDETVDDFAAEKRRLLREDLQNAITADEILMGSFIKGLRPEFEDLVGTMVTADENIELDDMLPALRDKEKKLGERREIDTSKSSTALNTSGLDETGLRNIMRDEFDRRDAGSAQANYGQGGDYKGGGYRGFRPWRPTNSTSKGWNKNKNNKSKNGKGGKGKGDDNGKGGPKERRCYNCQGMGHEAKDCPSKKADRR